MMTKRLLHSISSSAVNPDLIMTVKLVQVNNGDMKLIFHDFVLPFDSCLMSNLDLTLFSSDLVNLCRDIDPLKFLQEIMDSRSIVRK